MIRDKLYGLIISAGLSGRIGKFKPLLNYKNKTFVQTIATKLSKVCDKIIIVTGFKADELIENMEQLNEKVSYKIVMNPDFELGMFTSLQEGIRKARDADWILYHFVDQPNLPEKFYSNFISQIDVNYDWIQPAFQKQKGHPILFNEKIRKKILAADQDSNLRMLAKEGIAKKIWDCDYTEILTDIDTPKDFYSIK